MTASIAFAVPRRTDRTLLAGLLLLGVTVVLIVLSVTSLSGDPLAMVGRPFLKPGEDARFLLGTDMLGRDVLKQVAHGARVSLLIGTASTVLAVFIGAVVGLASGFAGGWLDRALTRVTEVFQTIPQLLFAIVLVAVLPPSIWSVIIAVGVTGWTTIARVLRPEVMRLRNADFIQAAQIGGMRPVGIVLREILPNVLGLIVVMASILIATAILTEAALSFLGLGDPNLVSWGSMIGAGRTVLEDGWHISLFPGIATVVTVLGFTLIGNGLNARFRRSTT